MASNAASLYAQISSNPEQTQALFRQALQDPNGAMASICSLGDQLGLPVTTQEVRDHLASLDDDDSKRWLCLLYTSPSPRDRTRSRMPSSA